MILLIFKVSHFCYFFLFILSLKPWTICVPSWNPILSFPLSFCPSLHSQLKGSEAWRLMVPFNYITLTMDPTSTCTYWVTLHGLIPLPSCDWLIDKKACSFSILIISLFCIVCKYFVLFCFSFFKLLFVYFYIYEGMK